MNAKTFVSNAEGFIEPIEITELEKSSGLTLRIMFTPFKDDVTIFMDKEGRVWVQFYKIGGRKILEPVGSHAAYTYTTEEKNGGAPV